MAADPSDLFGGLFDFNGDGQTDLTEEFLAYRMFEEVTGEAEDEETGNDEG